MSGLFFEMYVPPLFHSQDNKIRTERKKERKKERKGFPFGEKISVSPLRENESFMGWY